MPEIRRHNTILPCACSTAGGAKSGKYPNVENVGLNILEKFIADHFSKDTMDDAVEYCTQMSVMGYAEAKAVVERIFL